MPPPELTPDDKAYVEEKTRRMVAILALRRIQRLVTEYRDGKEPIDFTLHGMPRELPPAVRDAVPAHARRVAGFAAMWKLQQIARQYREDRAAAAKAARRIALFFAALCAAAIALFLVDPDALQALLRLLS